jgi:hypothetical protein
MLPINGFERSDMDVQKAGMVRLLLAAPDLRDSAWMIQDLAFLKLCEVYEHACLQRDVLRCSTQRDDAALLKAEGECKSLEAAAIAYIRERQKFSGII